MDLTQLLGASFDCSCGKHHSVPTEHFLYRADALTALPRLVQSIITGPRCLVIADSRTFEVAGRTVVDSLVSSGLQTDTFIVPDPESGSPQADDHTRDLMLAQIGPADLYIAVGSGVINDLVKWVAFMHKKPYIAVATAASMNGYGSANVAATIDGLKVLFKAAPPKAVLATPDIIVSAPFELSAAGLGDVLAKPVSSADWKLNQFLFQDYYCQFSVDLLKELEPVYLDSPERIKARADTGFRALFQALFYSSVAMTITGTSSPASGGEHLISHTLDILAGRDGVEHDLHGRQVGVSSILMAALYERVLSIEQPLFVHPSQRVDEGFWGALTTVVEDEYNKKLGKMEQSVRLLSEPGNWNRLKHILKSQLLPPDKLKFCLEQAGAAHRYADLSYAKVPLTREFFISVVCHANQMRERFTILDLALLLGIIPGEIDSLVDRWTGD